MKKGCGGKQLKRKSCSIQKTSSNKVPRNFVVLRSATKDNTRRKQNNKTIDGRYSKYISVLRSKSKSLTYFSNNYKKIVNGKVSMSGKKK